MLGFTLSLFIEIVDAYLLLPPIERGLYGHNIWWEQVPRFWDWMAHIAYGLSLGYFYVKIRDRKAASAVRKIVTPTPA